MTHHPSVGMHLLRGEVLSYNYVNILLDAIFMLQTDLVQKKLTNEFLQKGLTIYILRWHANATNLYTDPVNIKYFNTTNKTDKYVIINIYEDYNLISKFSNILKVTTKIYGINLINIILSKMISKQLLIN